MKTKSHYLLFFVLVLLSFACNRTQSAITKAETASGNTPTSNQPEISAEAENKSFNTPKKLTYLKEWIGKYPINSEDKKYGNFFELPDVKQILKEILKEDGYQKLLRHFSGYDLIKEKDGFLVMLGTTAKSAEKDVDYALVALNPDTGETHVLFAEDQKLSSFSNATGGGNLTAAIKREILVYTEESKTDLIGYLQQKPTAGFDCYAVFPKDWGGAADKRRYIFVSTDDGGIFNIEGRDVEIRMSDSSETKGENGRTYAEWIFDNKNIKAKFDLAIEKTFNDGADVQYEGTLTVTSDSKTQTTQVIAFCGG